MRTLYRLMRASQIPFSKKGYDHLIQPVTGIRPRALIQGVFLIFLIFAGAIPVTGQNPKQASEKSLPAYSVAGFLQQQFVADQADGTPLQFAIHRARLGMTGQVTDRIHLNFIAGMAEPPNNTPRLVNAFVGFDFHPLLQIRTGQFLLPFGLEGPEPIPLNPAIERTTAIRQLNPFTMFRDVGVQVSGSRSIVQYAVALVNGEGANQPAQLDPSDILGRVGFQPLRNMTLGISGHYGRFQPDLGTENSAVRTRFGVDMSYRPGSLFFRGEHITRNEELTSNETRTSTGAYLLGGYELSSHWQLIARYEYYTPDNDNSLTVLTAGFSYYFIENTRLSVNYGFHNDQTASQTDDLLQVQMQVVF